MNFCRTLGLAIVVVGLHATQDAGAVEGAAFVRQASFDRSNDEPSGSLALAADGRFYGVSDSLARVDEEGAIYRYAPGEPLTVVHRFVSDTEGIPVASLTPMPDGSLWGITLSGGEHGAGTVFRFDIVSGATTILHSFDDDEGTQPFGRLLLASDGFVYGTATEAGAYHAGSIFRIDPQTLAFEPLWFFGAQSKLGRGPAAGLTEGLDGRLYGTTDYGADRVHGGSLFAFEPVQRQMSLLYQFPQSVNYLEREVTIAPSGLIYGVTVQGGGFECGSVYSVRPNGQDFRIRHSFDCVHGANPSGSLTLASDGFLYGPVISNGPLYRIRPDAAVDFSILESHLPGGGTPIDALIEVDGALWGVSSTGGKYDGGFIFDFEPRDR